MDWSLIIFIAVLVFFTYRGYRKGLLKSLSRVLSLVAGYVAAILYASYISKLIEANTPLQGIVALVAASLLLFIGAGIFISLLFWIISELTPDEYSDSKGSTFGGAAVGSVVGMVVAILVVWTFAFVRDMQPAIEAVDPVAQQRSTIEDIANKVAGKTVSTAMTLSSARPEIANLGTALMQSPGEIAQQAQRLATSNDLNALLSDSDNQAVINSNDLEAVRALPDFQQLVKNPDLLALARSAGMIDDTLDDNTAVETALAGQITEIWRRMQSVQDDQRVQEILSDAEFQRKIQSGNPVDLLTNAKLLELADIIFSDETAANGKSSQTVNKQANNEQSDNVSPEKSAKKGTLIYSWTDKNGKTHYSDKKQGE